MSVSPFGVFPKRGFVQPQNSNDAAGHGPVYLVFDALVAENADYSATPTQSIVEDGSTVSDHVTQKPLRLTVQGIITDTPVGIRGSQYTSAFQSSKPSDTAFRFIEQLYLNRTPFDFVGGFKTYKSMVITRWTPQRDASTGDALRFGCVMEQVVIVASQVLYKLQKGPKSSQPKSSLGNQVLVGLDDHDQAIVDSTGDTLTAHSGGGFLFK